jgi:hypothetical protein
VRGRIGRIGRVVTGEARARVEGGRKVTEGLSTNSRRTAVVVPPLLLLLLLLLLPLAWEAQRACAALFLLLTFAESSCSKCSEMIFCGDLA